MQQNVQLLNNQASPGNGIIQGTPQLFQHNGTKAATDPKLTNICLSPNYNQQQPLAFKPQTTDKRPQAEEKPEYEVVPSSYPYENVSKLSNLSPLHHGAPNYKQQHLLALREEKLDYEFVPSSNPYYENVDDANLP